MTAPVQITVVSGSRVKLAVSSAAEGVVAELAGQPPLALARDRDGFVGEWLADRSTAVALRPAGGAGRDAKFLSVIVVPDAPPVVRVPTPGRDLAVTGTKGRIVIEVDGQDDLGLASLSVRFTKASGGGESVTFTEGEVPLAISRTDDRHWRGRAEWVLDGLELSDGDVLVYRAIARDRNPNGSPVQSEQYLVEVGKLAGAVGSGFALPAEEKKYAISQQMVIYKTEQLIASSRARACRAEALAKAGSSRTSCWRSSSEWCAPRSCSSAAVKCKTRSKRPRTRTKSPKAASRTPAAPRCCGPSTSCRGPRPS